MSQTATMAFLQVIQEHEGTWGWYQFERAFPPGWFPDVSPTARAKDILDRLEEEGLISRDAGKYRLTVSGADALRQFASVR